MRILTLISILSLSIATLFGQSHLGETGFATKGATVNVGQMANNPATDFSQFPGIKTPNKNWKAPEFKVNPDRIIYQ